MSNHFDSQGRPQMVDVSTKNSSLRRAVATARLRCSPQAFVAGAHGTAKKGNVIQIAETAGIMAAKQTANLIPLCHNLPLQSVKVQIHAEENHAGCFFMIRAETITQSETGVEMEALSAASIAGLTLYDMLKAYDKAMQLENIQLEEKTGGKSGDYFRR